MSKEWFAVMSRRNTMVVLGQGHLNDFPRRVRESLRRYLDRHWTNFWVVWREKGAYRLVRYRARRADRITTVVCSTIAEGESYWWRSDGRTNPLLGSPTARQAGLLRKGIAASSRRA